MCLMCVVCLVFPDLQVQNHFFFMCMCVVVAFQVEIHFLKVKLMVYYLKIDSLL